MTFHTPRARTTARWSSVAATALSAVAVTVLTSCSTPVAEVNDPATSPSAASITDRVSTLASSERNTVPPIHPSLIVPETFTVVTTRQEHHDAHSVTVTRAQESAAPSYGGAHVTTVIGEDGTLYGYTRQTEGFSAESMPTAEAAERTAFDVLRSIDPAFTDGLTVQWVDRHDETIAGADGSPVTVSGMKVKTRHDSGLYSWVIVGADNQVITYERDVTWDTGHSRRQTAMWLHDRWISARDNGGAELGGMDAPLN